MKAGLYSLLFFILLFYLSFRFFRLLLKMRQPVVFPMTREDWKAIRVRPEKEVGLPNVSNQKTGVLTNGLLLVLLTAVALVDVFIAKQNWPIFIVFIPALLNLTKVWNLFAVQEEGILCGERFLPWKRIQSYQFIPIDLNHHFYGFSSEVNEGWEFMIKTKFSTISCLVTTEEVKEKLTGLLDEQLAVQY